MTMAGIFYGICDQENTEGSYFQQGLEICYRHLGQAGTYYGSVELICELLTLNIPCISESCIEIKN